MPDYQVHPLIASLQGSNASKYDSQVIPGIIESARVEISKISHFVHPTTEKEYPLVHITQVGLNSMLGVGGVPTTSWDCPFHPEALC